MSRGSEERPQDYTLWERLGLVWAVLRGALLIGGAFLGGLGVVILGLLLLWGGL